MAVRAGRCAGVVLALLPGAPGAAAADLCRLLLDVETDAADAMDGVLPPAGTRAARIAEIGALASTQRDLARPLLALSLAYRSADVRPSAEDLAVDLRSAAGGLRWLAPACDVPPPARPMNGEVLTPRPPATAARQPEAPAKDPGALKPPPPPRSARAEGEGAAGADRQGGRPGGEAAGSVGSGRALALVLLGAVAALWGQWFFVMRPAGARRYPCRVPAVLRLGGRRAQTRLEDISRFGARVRLYETEVEIGDHIDVSCAHFARLARVQWANASYAGLRFRAPIGRSVIDACVQDTGATGEEASARP